MLASHNPSAHAPWPGQNHRDQFSLGPQSVSSSKPGPGMWRTGLRGSIYEVQRECLSWWVMDSKLITPPPPVSHKEQKLWRGAHDKSYGPDGQCARPTRSAEATLQLPATVCKLCTTEVIQVHLYRSAKIPTLQWRQLSDI